MESNVWYEKYRPQSVTEVILPDQVKQKILRYLENGGKDLPHLGLFSRTPGTGKSSLANAILKDTGAEALWINASLDKGIDVLRGRIQRFSAQRPLREDCIKIVVLDEFDHFTKDGQAAFRGFIDQFGENVRFIFTGNYKENVIEPLLDRLEVYDFNTFGKEEVAKAIFERLIWILDQEHIVYDKADVVKIIKQNYPKIRKMVGDLRACTIDGKLVFSAIDEDEKFEQLLSAIQSKNLTNIQTICYALTNLDGLYTFLGNHLSDISTDSGKHLNMLIALAKYQYQNTAVRDKNLNALACCAELLRL